MSGWAHRRRAGLLKTAVADNDMKAPTVRAKNGMKTTTAKVRANSRSKAKGQAKGLAKGHNEPAVADKTRSRGHNEPAGSGKGSGKGPGKGAAIFCYRFRGAVTEPIFFQWINYQPHCNEK